MARKLEREQKKKVEGEGGGEKRKRLRASVSFIPSPVIPFFFALVPTFLDELERKRLLRRLSDARQPEVRLSPFLYTLMLTNLYC